MSNISFKTTNDEFDLVIKIVDRIETYFDKYEIEFTRMTASMDLVVCHANGMPLDFAALLAADESNFLHDVLGIRRHINRDTGKLENCFVPRFAKRYSKAA